MSLLVSRVPRAPEDALLALLLRQYHAEHADGGRLEPVLHHGAVADDDVTFCLTWARAVFDLEAASLASLLLGASVETRHAAVRSARAH